MRCAEGPASARRRTRGTLLPPTCPTRAALPRDRSPRTELHAGELKVYGGKVAKARRSPEKFAPSFNSRAVVGPRVFRVLAEPGLDRLRLVHLLHHAQVELVGGGQGFDLPQGLLLSRRFQHE